MPARRNNVNRRRRARFQVDRQDDAHAGSVRCIDTPIDGGHSRRHARRIATLVCKSSRDVDTPQLVTDRFRTAVRTTRRTPPAASNHPSPGMGHSGIRPPRSPDRQFEDRRRVVLRRPIHVGTFAPLPVVRQQDSAIDDPEIRKRGRAE